MVVRHLLVGIACGLVAALVSVWTGFSLWTTIGAYIVAAHLGLLASALVGLVDWRQRAAKMARKLRGPTTEQTSSLPG